MPHLACYLSVDEIDALVPKRGGKDTGNKGDCVATLLSLIGGIKDVPNLIFVASTNFAKKIDEAISRRMSEKFFVGRLFKDDREYLIINQLEKFNFNKLIEYESILKAKLLSNNHDLKKKKRIHPDHDDAIVDLERDLTEGDLVDLDLSKGNLPFFDLIDKKDLSKLNEVLINFTPAAIINLVGKIKVLFIEKLKKCKSENGKLVGYYKMNYSELRNLAQESANVINIS